MYLQGAGYTKEARLELGGEVRKLFVAAVGKYLFDDETDNM